MPQSSLLPSAITWSMTSPVTGPNSSESRTPPAFWVTSEFSTTEFVAETRWMPSPQSPGANGVVKHSPAPTPTTPENPRSLLTTLTWLIVTLLIGDPDVRGVPSGAAMWLPTRMPANWAFMTVQPSIVVPDPPGPTTSMP